MTAALWLPAICVAVPSVVIDPHREQSGQDLYGQDLDKTEMNRRPAMESRRLNVFFYGLFMDETALRAKGFNPRNARPARVAGMGLRIGARATLVADAQVTAHGILMQLTHDEIDRLYSEPSVTMYRAEAVLAEFADGSHVAALCFNLPKPPRPEETNPDYAARLREVARRSNLPSDYIATIT
jgi:hypothetical protein